MLAVGDIVHRHLMDGDVVLVGRQPSIDEQSLTALIVRRGYGSVIRTNPGVQSIMFRGDYDGDTNYVLVPQSEEARAEAFSLLALTNSIVSPMGTHVAVIQDTILGAWQFTSRDTFFTWEDAMQLFAQWTISPRCRSQRS